MGGGGGGGEREISNSQIKKKLLYFWFYKITPTRVESSNNTQYWAQAFRPSQNMQLYTLCIHLTRHSHTHCPIKFLKWIHIFKKALSIKFIRFSDLIVQLMSLLINRIYFFPPSFSFLQPSLLYEMVFTYFFCEWVCFAHDL